VKRDEVRVRLANVASRTPPEVGQSAVALRRVHCFALFYFTSSVL